MYAGRYIRYELKRRPSAFSDIVGTVAFPLKWRTSIEMHPVTPININTVPSVQRGWLTAAAALIVAAAAFPARADDSKPTWQVDVYYPVGSIVSYHGHQYQALLSQVDFHDTDWNPAVPSLWKELGAQGRFSFHATWFTHVSNTESRCATLWSDSTIYTTGGLASVDGVNYRANWWTQGESPDTHNAGGHGQPWTMVGSCAERAPSATAESDDTRPTAPSSKDTRQAQTEDHTG